MAITLEELKEICREQTPELFQPGREADLLKKVQAHLFFESYWALMDTALTPDQADGLPVTAEAHSHFAALFREWRDEIRHQLPGWQTIQKPVIG